MPGQPQAPVPVRETFRWDIPDHYNIGTDVCDRIANHTPDRLALIDVDQDGGVRQRTFGQLRSDSDRLANALRRLGLRHQGERWPDRVGVLLPQRLETAVAHIAVLKSGGISIPLFTLFGEQALLHRLQDSGATMIITDRAGCGDLAGLRDRLPDLLHVLCVDGAAPGAIDLPAACAIEPDRFEAVNTRADDPALLIYTSGTTGNPKGALHAHRVLLGHLPGVETAFNGLPHANDRFWTPADWAWIGGLLDVLMPALHHGITVVAHRFRKFDPVTALQLMHTFQVRNAFLPPTALKMMRRVPEADVPNLALRSIGSGGESLGVELNAWCERALGVSVNEFYGQTECNMIVSSCCALEPSVPGAMGRAVPGHRVDIIDATTGAVLDDDREGAIAVRAPDPVMFLEYWNDKAATEEKFIDGPDGRWLLSGDRGLRRTDGRLQFIARDDDVIGSAGYRIGPGEIEECLLCHPAVALAGAIAWPDELRGAVVAAYVTLVDDAEPSAELADEIARFVRTRLAAHEYPRVVRFVDALPMTTTGKIIRAELRQWAEVEQGTEGDP